MTDTPSTTPAVSQPWSHEWQEVAQALKVDPQRGLSAAEARNRLAAYGPNELRQIKARSAWAILFAQFKNIIVLLLAIAAALAFAMDDAVEAVAILAVIFINAAIGFWMELQAVRAMEALRKLGRVETTVKRDGHARRIAAEQLVPGDIVILEGGDVITADLRLWKASRLQASEAVLTGESAPVAKQIGAVDAETQLAEREPMLFKGTAITRGSAEALVIATGMDTELGRISALVESAQDTEAPIQKRLDKLGHALVVATLIVAALVIASGLAQGRELGVLILTGIALAVATVPEGLPIVATIAMARGMREMARRNALIRQLPAVETLGSTNVILTDKTGTLTENRMTVEEVAWGDQAIRLRDMDQRHEPLMRILRVAVLCNNASLGDDVQGNPQSVGDPLETALLAAGAAMGLRREQAEQDWPRTREEAFDSETKMMATFHRREGGFYAAVKGAPESVLQACSAILRDGRREPMDEHARQAWSARNDEMARRGYRVLAVAEKQVDSDTAAPYEDLALLGLLGLLDPPRDDVREAIETCHRAGIKIVMITGDQAATALNVGQAVGLITPGEEELRLGDSRAIRKPAQLDDAARASLLEASAFARATPEQKLDLIALHQDNGAIVAMIGDGVNDAPALRKADIGVAMGQRGTQIAREAADMILEDDSFPTIVTAVEQGRVIFQNIRKFVAYLLSCNVSEVLVVGIASLLAAPLPILPLQILFLNLVTDVFPALALGVGRGEAHILRNPPRDPKLPIITRFDWSLIVAYGAAITVAVLGAQAAALNVLGLAEDQMITVCFLVLALSQLFHVFNMREEANEFLRNEVTENRWVWGALALCVGLLLGAVYTPGLSQVMHLPDPGAKGWLLAAGMTAVAFALGEAIKFLEQVFKRRLESSAHPR